MNVGKILAKTAGIAGLTLIGIDAHNAGKMQAMSTQNSIKASSLEDSYVNTMTQDSPSSVVSGYKKFLFRLNTDEVITDFFTGIGGYFKGACSMLIQNVLPLGLALGSFAKKGIIGKGSALGLLAYGLVYGIQNSGFTDSKKL